MAMSSLRSLFLQHIAQTSPNPLMLQVKRAEGVFIYDENDQPFFDLVSGISVSALGHLHPNITSAIKKQLTLYLHTQVYGEHIQDVQVELASALSKILGAGFESTYFLNSGSEAIDLAIKLSRKYTERYEVVACKNAYHGSTIAAGSLRSDDEHTLPYQPAMPGVRHIRFNNFEDLDKISSRTACVIIEPVQAEAGVITPVENYLAQLRIKCRDTGTLLIFDEIQTGLGRTGYLFAFQKYQVQPDVIVLAKALGGGLPLSAVCTNRDIMSVITHGPILGHITTYGGNPLCCAAGLGFINHLTHESTVCKVSAKEKLFKERLVHPLIQEVRSSGLMIAVALKDEKLLIPTIDKARQNGVIIDFFLFNKNSFRLAPPLIITNEQIEEVSHRILRTLDSFV